MDSVSASSLSEKTSNPLIYYEKYKVIPLKNIDSLNVSSLDSALIIQLENQSYLLPSGGEYKLVDLLGDGDLERVLQDRYYMSDGDTNPFKTRHPMFLRLGFSKKWDKQAKVAADMVTGFSNRNGSSSSWKLLVGTEIIRFKNKFIRLGYAFGGVAGKSMSVGYGHKFGPMRMDVAFAFNGGFNISTAKGLDLAIGFIWQP